MSGSGERLRILTAGGREIRWVLRRKNVKNVNLRVKPDGIVYISAGERVSIGFIEDFIRRKADFIFAALGSFGERAAAPELPERDKAYRDGDILRFFGKDYALRIEVDVSISYAAQEKAAIAGGEIAVSVRYADRVGTVLEKFFEEETRRLFTELNRQTALMFRARGYSAPDAELRIRSMTSRWGSCHIADKRIVMNSRLALYPEICAAYVFVHEYAHFFVPDHSKAFYAVVEDIMPDYKVCAGLLKK